MYVIMRDHGWRERDDDDGLGETQKNGVRRITRTYLDSNKPVPQQSVMSPFAARRARRLL